VLAPNVRIHAGAYVEGAVLMDGVQIGKGAVVRRAILDKGVVVPDGAHIGVDSELDRERYTYRPPGSWSSARPAGDSLVAPVMGNGLVAHRTKYSGCPKFGVTDTLWRSFCVEARDCRCCPRSFRHPRAEFLLE